MRPARVLAVLTLALLLAGCASTEPVRNIANDWIGHPRPLAPAQVRAAIIQASAAQGWRITDEAMGRLEATRYAGERVAIVDLPYSATQYRIELKRAENLGAGAGAIHRDYNLWVVELDRAIRAAISRL